MFLLVCLLLIVLSLFTHSMQEVAPVKKLTKTHILLNLRNWTFILNHFTVIPKIIMCPCHLHIYFDTLAISDLHCVFLTLYKFISIFLYG